MLYMNPILLLTVYILCIPECKYTIISVILLSYVYMCVRVCLCVGICECFFFLCVCTNQNCPGLCTYYISM